MNSFADLDAIPANNTKVLGQPVLGNVPINQVDEMVRSVLGLLARYYADLGGVVSVSLSLPDTISIVSASTYATLKTGMVLGFQAVSTNAGAMALNLDALGAKAIRKDGDAPLSPGDIVAKGMYLVRYDAALNGGNGCWALLNPTAAALQIASAANFRANVADKVLDTDGVWASAVPVDLGATLTGAVSFDFNTFINGKGTITGNITSLGGTNIKKGQSGTIELTQSGGPWTLSVNTANFVTNNGAGIALGTGLNVLSYIGLDSGKAMLSLAAKAVA